MLATAAQLATLAILILLAVFLYQKVRPAGGM